MKQTRSIKISDKVFTGEDLRRIAKIFDKQKTLAAKSGHTDLITYTVVFSDDTTFESDSPELFDDESLIAPARPVAVRMSFYNLTLKRHLALSMNHGNLTHFTNEGEVSAGEPAWLGENFLALKEALDKVAPQSFWFRRHPFVLMNLLALGLGSIGNLIIDIAMHIFFPHGPPWTIKNPGAWAPYKPLLHTLDWFMLWVLGNIMGAGSVGHWLLSLWPSIEFDFGLDHLKIERVKRKRLIAVGALIVLPIMTSLIAELIYGRL